MPQTSVRRRATFFRRARVVVPAVMLALAIVASLLVVAFSLRPSPASPAKPLIVSSSTWEPYVGPELPEGGPITALVTEVLRRAGYQPEVRFTSWSLTEQRVREGASAGTFPLVASRDRAPEFLASEPLAEFEYVLFYDSTHGVPTIDEPSDFEDLRVGSVAGYDYWDEIADAVGNRWIKHDTSLDGFEALAAGEIDLLVEGRISGQAVLSSSEFSGDVSSFDYVRGNGPLVHSIQGIHFMTARTDESAALIEAFDAELDQIRDSGEYEKFLGGLAGPSSVSVQLVPFGGDELVELLDADGKVVLLAPNGTEAVVTEWPEELTAESTQQADDILVEVKIMNGPSTGRIAHVDARTIVLGGDA